MKIKKSITIFSLILLGTQAFAQQGERFDSHSGGGFHQEAPRATEQFHSNHDYRTTNNFNSDRVGSTPNRFNNDTVNINERGNPYNGNWNNEYRGWNQGPVGFNNGWSNGWNHGYTNGGFWTGVGEAVIGGLAATALYNWLFNHNSSPSVVYANGGGSSGSYYGDSQNQQPDETVNNTTTNNTVVEEDDSNIGLWLLGLGGLILAGAGLAYYLRRGKHEHYIEEEYYDEPRRNQARPAHYERDSDYIEDRIPHRLEGRNPPRHSGNRVPDHHRERY